MRQYRIFIIFSSLCFFNFCPGETLRITTYNILNFPEALGIERQAYLFTVLDYIKPDILVVQELKNHQGFEIFRDSIVARLNSNFCAGPFYDGPDTDNGIFFRRDKVDFISVQYIPTAVRDIAEYRMRFRNSGSEFYVYSVHFKSSPGLENEIERNAEALRLKQRLDSLPLMSYFLVMGDFNIYYSDEPAYQTLLDTTGYHRVIKDLNGIFGLWHENEAFAHYHTQSTRLIQLPDGGADGGLDDRFDMILCSENFLIGDGLILDIDSYKISGNDGEHFDRSINDGENNAVPAEIANALYYASDHLPCSVDITDKSDNEIVEPPVRIVPNPMKSRSWVHIPWCEDFISARMTLTNILGQRVYQAMTTNPEGFAITNAQLSVGVYFVHLEISTKYLKYYYHTRLAVIE